MPSLRGHRPRGWPPGRTMDDVNGLHFPSRNEVIIAVLGHGTKEGAHVPKYGRESGSYNVVIHESMHSIDHSPGILSPEFQAARKADLGALSAYETQPTGVGGLEETYAESAARYYGGDPEAVKRTPNLTAFWRTHPGGALRTQEEELRGRK